tara:strand:+ start:2037 stop:3233 length:1197 start_codon:yes stop_codon:yes gene_type:complete
MALAYEEANARLKEKNIVCGRKARYQTMIATGQIRKTCTLTDPITGERCTKPHKARGMCVPHWSKDRKYGDPFAGDNGASKRRKPPEEIEELLARTGHTLVGKYVNNRTPVDCRHECGKVEPMHIGNLIAGAIRHGCSNPDCRPNQNKTSDEEAIRQMKELGWTTLTNTFPGANKPWKSIHDACGDTHSPCLSNIKTITSKGKGGTGCVTCGIEATRNKRKTDDQIILDLIIERGFRLLSGDYVHSNAPLDLLCLTCNKRTTPSANSLRDRHGCKYCNGGLFTMHPTVLYLMKNSERNALKVGIASEGRSARNRIREHINCGFSLVNTWLFETGEPAYNTEQEVLRHWRDDLNAPEHLTKDDMFRGGHTETVSMRKVGLQRTIDYIEAQVQQKLLVLR